MINQVTADFERGISELQVLVLSAIVGVNVELFALQDQHEEIKQAQFVDNMDTSILLL